MSDKKENASLSYRKVVSDGTKGEEVEIEVHDKTSDKAFKIFKKIRDVTK